MEWAGHVARVEKRRPVQSFYRETHKSDTLEDVEGEILLQCVLKKWNIRTWTGLTWLRIGTDIGLLWMRWRTFVFDKMPIISWLAEELLASQEWLYCMKFTS
jgi:hypothetical protein